MEDKRRIFGLSLSTADLEDYLIEKYGFPKDTMIVNWAMPPNQRGWAIQLHSKEFPVTGELDTYATARFPEGYKYKREDENV